MNPVFVMNLLENYGQLFKCSSSICSYMADTSHILQFVHSNTSHARGLGFIMIKIVIRHFLVNTIDLVQPAYWHSFLQSKIMETSRLLDMEELERSKLFLQSIYPVSSDFTHSPWQLPCPALYSHKGPTLSDPLLCARHWNAFPHIFMSKLQCPLISEASFCLTI